MCRFYQCFSQEWDEDDVTDAVYLLTNALANPKSDKRDFTIKQCQATIRSKEPRMIGIAEQDYAAIEMLRYQEHLDDRATIANMHNKFRRNILVTAIDLEACPI